MSTQNAVLLALNVLALSIGQVLFKLAARAIDGSAPLLHQIAFNGYLAAALVVYGLATAFWVALLRQVPLHVAYPFVGLAFVLVPVMAHLVLREPLHWQTLAGAVLIFGGVWISGLK